MNRVLRVLLALTLLGTLWSVLICGAMLLLPPSNVAAQPPPAKTPIPPTVVPPTQPPPEPTAKPTDPPPPTAVPPTEEPPPQPPTAQPTAPPMPQPVDEPSGDSKPDPNCQSVVEGYVANAAGSKVAGASVKVEGDGWSRGMMTDDDGRYGFGGLCPSTAMLGAVLPGGQATTRTTVDLDGKNRAEVDLSVGQSELVQPTATVQPTAQPKTVAAATTADPGMPSTGFPGWLFIGVAAIGAVVVLAARTCWGLAVRSRDSQSQNHRT